MRRCAHSHIIVTPFMGVWIEIEKEVSGLDLVDVTPFMGVWIEMPVSVSFSDSL